MLPLFCVDGLKRGIRMDEYKDILGDDVSEASIPDGE